MGKEEFAKRLSGFVLAGNLEEQKEDVVYEPVSDAMKSFVWGNRWIDNSDQLPGIMSDGQIALQAGLALVGALAGPFGALMLGIQQLTSVLVTICVMQGACSQDD